MPSPPEKLLAQTRILIGAVYDLRYIYPDGVQDYCDALLTIAKAIGLEVPEE